MRSPARSLTALLLLLFFINGNASDSFGQTEVLPPVPEHYFNDYAQLVQPVIASELDQKLAQFDRDTTNQVLVAIYPGMQSKASLTDYTLRLMNNWGVGQKGRDNGVVLFVFIQDHLLRLQVGRGLTGVLPDELCKRIIDDDIAPGFRQKDFEGGLRTGITAILAAVEAGAPPNAPSQNTESALYVKPAVLLPAMSPTQENFEKFRSSVETISAAMTVEEISGAQSSDEGKKHALKKTMVDSMTAAGFDLDSTLTTLAKQIHDKSLTQDEYTVALGVMAIYHDEASDLARWGFIQENTKTAVESTIPQ